MLLTSYEKTKYTSAYVLRRNQGEGVKGAYALLRLYEKKREKNGTEERKKREERLDLVIIHEKVTRTALWMLQNFENLLGGARPPPPPLTFPPFKVSGSAYAYNGKLLPLLPDPHHEFIY